MNVQRSRGRDAVRFVRGFEDMTKKQLIEHIDYLIDRETVLWEVIKEALKK